MIKKIIFILLLVIVATIIFKSFNTMKNSTSENTTEMADLVSIDPINHASMILAWDGMYLYVDPVDEKGGMFAGKPEADAVFITDIHQDHLDVETLASIVAEKTVIIAPQAVKDQIPLQLQPKVSVMNNGDIAEHLGFTVGAIPMYNLPGPSEQYHSKGRGNGYVIEKNGTRVYISGDTAGIPEMRALKNIDIAFVAMNLPYTMGVEEAADAVLEFKPKQVYPYHYRQNPTNDFADVAKFKTLVNESDPAIHVVELDWYAL